MLHVTKIACYEKNHLDKDGQPIHGNHDPYSKGRLTLQVPE